MGRPPINKKAMSNAQRQSKRREKQRLEEERRNLSARIDLFEEPRRERIRAIMECHWAKMDFFDLLRNKRIKKVIERHWPWMMQQLFPDAK
jgi:hypothetical protein